MQFIRDIICQFFHRGYHIKQLDTRTAETFLFGEVYHECLTCGRKWISIE